MIAVQGSIQTRSYEDKTGAKRTAVEIVADSVSFCGSKASDAGQNRFEAPAANAPSIRQATPQAFLLPQLRRRISASARQMMMTTDFRSNRQFI